MNSVSQTPPQFGFYRLRRFCLKGYPGLTIMITNNFDNGKMNQLFYYRIFEIFGSCALEFICYLTASYVTIVTHVIYFTFLHH